MQQNLTTPTALFNLHSNYSIGYGASDLRNLMKTAVQYGYKTVALTDINNLYTLFNFMKDAPHFGLKAIVGAHLLDRNFNEITAYVQSYDGFSNLCQLISKIKRNSNSDLYALLPHHLDGLVFTTPSIEIVKWIRQHQLTDNIYLEIKSNRISILQIRSAREMNVKTIASHPVFFQNSSDYEVHRLLRAILENKTFSTLDESRLVEKDSFILKPDQMMKRFELHPQAIDNLEILSNSLNWKYPEKLSFRSKYLQENDLPPFEYLKKLTMEGAVYRYGEITESVDKRLKKELEIIEAKGFSEYFLTVKKIVDHASVHCGRGSAAASIVSYCLGITDVDPIKYNLFFERFLNMDREDPPDIDIDFCSDEREDVFKYVFETFGQDYAAMVSNHVCFKDRMAIREVAKAHGVPETDIQSFFHRFPEFSHYGSAFLKNDTLSNNGLTIEWNTIVKQANQIYKFPKYLSVHCGGFVVTPNKISTVAPVEPTLRNQTILQWEKDQTEDSGLIKIDILGNRSLCVIRDCIKHVKEHYETVIDFNSFDVFTDQPTIDLIANGNTIGVFYVESPAMRLLQQKTRCGDFDHLVIHSSIIRPAANKYINEYVRRLKGGSHKPIHPVLEEMLGETYGIMCYQEDVIKAGMSLAGMNQFNGTQLLKSLIRKHDDEIKKKYKNLFFEGCRKNGISESIISEIWDMIFSFAGYSFCKPHSASYVMVSFQSAYFRSHFPAEFMAAVISNRGGYYSTFAYISEARRMGITILMPDINKSEYEFSGFTYKPNNSDDDLPYPNIRVGLMQLKNMEDEFVKKIIDDRKRRGNFKSLQHFIERLHPKLSELQILIKAGCFDSISSRKTRPEMMWEAEFSFQQTNPENELMFDLFQTPEFPVPKTVEYTEEKKYRDEYETLHIWMSVHPLTYYGGILRGLHYVPGNKIQYYIGKKITTIGWFITHKVVHTKNDEPMEFVSFEDTSAIYETVFFPREYQKFCSMITVHRPYKIRGLVMEEFSAVTLQVERIEFLQN